LRLEWFDNDSVLMNLISYWFIFTRQLISIV